MNFYVLSDIHLEMRKNFASVLKTIPIELKEDTILILAGDIGYPFNKHKRDNLLLVGLLNALKSRFNQIVYVPGNHEYYQCSEVFYRRNDMDIILKNICNECGVTFLNRDSIKIGNVTILGCTLWSKVDDITINAMNDRTMTGFGRKELLRMHKEDLDWLSNELKQPNDNVLVVTHHLPTETFISENKFNKCKSGYATNVLEKIEYTPNVWVCGHAHQVLNMDFIGNNNRLTRLYRNPLGYPGEKMPTKTWNGSFRM